MDKKLLKTWRRELHDLQRRKNELTELIKASNLSPATEQRDQQVQEMEAKKAMLLSQIEEHKRVGTHEGFSLSSSKLRNREYKNPRVSTNNAPPKAKAGKAPSPERIEKLELRVKEINSELKNLIPAFHGGRIKSLRKEKRRIVAELREVKPQTRLAMRRRWSKGPGRVRFWRGQNSS